MRTQTFSTHQRNHSNERIDYALATPDISNSIDSAGYLPFGMYYKGDHRSFYLDLEIDKLLGDKITDIATPQKRGINSKDKKNRAKYVQAKYEELQFHNFFDRLTGLNSSSDYNPELIEQLDRDWLRSSLYAEN